MMKSKNRVRLFGRCYQKFWEYLRVETRNMPQNTNKEKLKAMVFFFSILGLTHTLIFLPIVIILAGILWFMSWVSVNTVAILSVLVIVWCIIDTILSKIKESQNSMVMNDELIANRYANFLICPVLHVFYGRKIDPDILLYTGSHQMGDGFYYSLPEPITDEVDRKTLQKKLCRKYAEMTQSQLQDVINLNIIEVTGTFIFVKK